MAEKYETKLKLVPTESQWQHGSVERHGDVMPDVVAMTIEPEAVVG